MYLKQNWLRKREPQLVDLILSCRDDEERSLLFDLLYNYIFLNNDDYDRLLNETIEYIIGQSGFDPETTQIVAMAWDDESDSSQYVLHSIKSVLMYKGWTNFKCVNRINRVNKHLGNGRNQIIIIDEFIGSGKTLSSRLKQLRNDINLDFDLKVCYLVGMDHAITKMKAELNVDIFCALKIKRGLSDRYPKGLVRYYKETLINLEVDLLQDIIKNKKLSDYYLGFGQAEALFSGEGYKCNTPNSVFPIFWWPLLKGNIKRRSLLTRYEKDFI